MINMRVAGLLAVALAKLSTAYVVSMGTVLYKKGIVSHPVRSISHSFPRDDSNVDDNTHNGGGPNAGVIAASVVFGIVAVTVVVVVSVLYCKDRNICRSIRKGKGRSSSIYSTAALKEHDVTTRTAQSLNRASFASERESIMYSRSRSPSVNFAIIQVESEYKPFVQDLDTTASVSQTGQHMQSIPLIVHHPPQSSTTSELAEIVTPPPRIDSTSPDQQQRRLAGLGDQPRSSTTRDSPAPDTSDSNERSPMLPRS